MNFFSQITVGSAQKSWSVVSRNMHILGNLRKPRIVSPLRSLCVTNEVNLVPLACEDDFRPQIEKCLPSSESKR